MVEGWKRSGSKKVENRHQQCLKCDGGRMARAAPVLWRKGLEKRCRKSWFRVAGLETLTPRIQNDMVFPFLKKIIFSNILFFYLPHNRHISINGWKSQRLLVLGLIPIKIIKELIEIISLWTGAQQWLNNEGRAVLRCNRGKERGKIERSRSGLRVGGQKWWQKGREPTPIVLEV